jgi:hypothetical protein
MNIMSVIDHHTFLNATKNHFNTAGEIESG